MLPRIYVDTNVYMDLLTPGRKNKFCNFADLASLTFNQVKSGKYTLVISDWVIEEFKKYYDEKIITNFLTHFENTQVVKIITEPKDKQKARELSSNNYDDALHIVLALKGNCIYFITRDTAHLFEFNDLIEILLPGWL